MATHANRGDQAVVTGSQRSQMSIKGYTYEGNNVGRFRNDASKHYFPESALVAFTSDFQGSNILVNPAVSNNYLFAQLHPFSLGYPISSIVSTSSFPLGQAAHTALWTEGVDEWRTIYRNAKCYAVDLELSISWNQQVATAVNSGMYVGAIWVPADNANVTYLAADDPNLTSMESPLSLTNTITDVKNAYMSYKWPNVLIFKRGRNEAGVHEHNQRTKFHLHIDAHEAWKFTAQTIDDAVFDLSAWLADDGASTVTTLGQTVGVRPGGTDKKLGRWDIRFYSADGLSSTLSVTALEANAYIKLTQHCLLYDNIIRHPDP